MRFHTMEYGEMDELCWEYLMMYIADCIDVMFVVTQSCLQVSN